MSEGVVKEEPAPPEWPAGAVLKIEQPPPDMPAGAVWSSTEQAVRQVATWTEVSSPSSSTAQGRMSEGVVKEEPAPPVWPAGATLKVEEPPPEMPAGAVWSSTEQAAPETEAPGSKRQRVASDSLSPRTMELSTQLPAGIGGEAQTAGRWRVFVFLVWLFERMRFSTQVSHPPTSRDVAAAIMFVQLGGRASLAWCARDGPLGIVPRTGTRLPQLVRVLLQSAELRSIGVVLPTGQCPLRQLTPGDAARVEEIAWISAMSLFQGWRHATHAQSTPSPPHTPSGPHGHESPSPPLSPPPLPPPLAPAPLSPLSSTPPPHPPAPPPPAPQPPTTVGAGRRLSEGVVKEEPAPPEWPAGAVLKTEESPPDMPAGAVWFSTEQAAPESEPPR